MAERSIAGRGWRTVCKAAGTCGVALVLFLIGACFGATAVEAFADFQLTVYTAAERNSPAVENLLQFVQLVEDRTNNRVEFDFLHGGALGGDEDAVDDVHVGVLDFVLAPLSAYDEFYPKVHTWALPFLFRDRAHLHEAIFGLPGRQLLVAMERTGLKGLALWDGGFRHVGTVHRPVQQLEDVAGLRVAVQSDAQATAWKAFGAEPVVVPWRDAASALTRGDVDALDATPDMAHRAGTGEVLTHYSLIHHSWMGYVLAVNPWVWKDLPVHIRQAIQEAAYDVARSSADRWTRANEQALARLEAAGVHVERNPDLTGFRERAEAAYGEMREEPWFDRTFVGQIQALVDE